MTANHTKWERVILALHALILHDPSDRNSGIVILVSMDLGYIFCGQIEIFIEIVGR